MARRKATAIPGGGGGGCWLGGRETASTAKFNGGGQPVSNLHGSDLFGETVEKKHTSKLGDEFLIPPFTVLSAREGWWQERKRAWLSLGIQSELGRGEQLIPNGGGLASKARYDKGGGQANGRSL